MGSSIDGSSSSNGHARSLTKLTLPRGLCSGPLLAWLLQPWQLRRLELTLTRTLTDQHAAMLASACPYLHALVLRQAASVTDAGVHALLHGCGLLRKLALSGGRALTDASLWLMLTGLHGTRCDGAPDQASKAFDADRHAWAEAGRASHHAAAAAARQPPRCACAGSCSTSR